VYYCVLFDDDDDIDDVGNVYDTIVDDDTDIVIDD